MTGTQTSRSYPEVEAALRAGDLCLSTVNELARVLTPENRAEVLPRFFGLSRREAEAVAATLRPAEVVPTRDVITAIRPPAQATTLRAAPAKVAGPPELPAFTEGAFHPGEPAEVPLPPEEAITRAAPAAPPPASREAVEMLDGELARLHTTVPRRLLEKLEAAKDVLGHACPEDGTAGILERGLDRILAQHAKRQGLVEKPRESGGCSRPDTVPDAVKREVDCAPPPGDSRAIRSRRSRSRPRRREVAASTGAGRRVTGDQPVSGSLNF